MSVSALPTACAAAAVFAWTLSGLAPAAEAGAVCSRAGLSSPCVSNSDMKPSIVLGGSSGNGRLRIRDDAKVTGVDLRDNGNVTNLFDNNQNRSNGLVKAWAEINEDGSVVDTPVKTTLGGIEFTVTFIDPWTARDQQTVANHGGLMIHTGDEDFWFAGQGITITFKGADDRPPLVGIDFAEEGVFDSQGKWIPGRRLNGDQTHQGRHIRLPPGKPQIQKVRFYRYR